MADNQDKKAVIFVTARNCETYIARAIESLRAQTIQNFEILMVDDASTDATGDIAEEVLEREFGDRSTFFRNPAHIGKAANAYKYLRQVEGDYVAILDGDDAVIDSHVLEDFGQAYSDGYDVVWSNYRMNDGRIGHCRPLNPLQSPRVQQWRTAHFFSFSMELFRNIPDHYFKDSQGDWFMSACDQAIALPVLDQTRRYKYFDRTAYEYTCDNLMSHHNINGLTKGMSSSTQSANSQQVFAKKPMDLINRLDDAPVPYADYLAAKKFCDVMNENGELNLTLPQLENVLRQVKLQYPEISEKLKQLL